MRLHEVKFRINEMCCPEEIGRFDTRGNMCIAYKIRNRIINCNVLFSLLEKNKFDVSEIRNSMWMEMKHETL